MKMLTSLLWILATLAGGYLMLLAMLYLLQSHMVYYPISRLTYTPGDIGLQYEDITFRAADSVQLHGWFVPAEGQAQATVLFFHGNAGNISGRIETIGLLNEIGVDLFIFDYRGYGQSKGKPSETGTYQDALGAWQYLTGQRNRKGDSIILMGRSLGGAVAAWLAGEVQPGGVVLESTFTSAADLGSELYPFFPVRQIIRFEYDVVSKIGKIQAPLLVAHSRDDELVPFSHGRKLYEAADEPKTFLEMRGSHGNGFLQTGPRYRQALESFVTRVASINR